ncbi:flavin-dependent dehydrogenase [Sphaerotilus hippei]|uniref:Flavin-dependent dehydrogenase n=1 Tax=Sphaerotilus hippei TaxID=744406 RepID=A0A318H1C0_9BURK|nr:NAD(P)/FAD-dependent oxidoreductase [Sphaerotilus hippei]PXW96648.1 flavin-dependent dehydrogenase [Sphaerotilus hippei]
MSVPNSAPHDPAPAPRGHHCDVLIIGGGPAGSTLATLLARRGRDVVVLEREHHPRFHIGESLLPANVPLFDELGLREDLERIGMPKWGVEFVSPHHEHRSLLEFGDAWDKSQPYAWQVRRADMDELLFRHAGREGARTLEGHRAREVKFDADGADVSVELDDGSRQQWRTRFVVDASGRDTLLANQLRIKHKHPRHNSSALFGHFTGARRLDGRQEGNITILWFPHGWFWFIPLADGSTSVGAVCWPHYLKSRRKPLVEFFHDTIAMSPELADRLKDATLVDDQVHATGNYAYVSEHCAGERYLMLGDAFAFIDPVFSSGVYLAMKSAFAGVDVIDATLDQPRRAAAARRGYEKMMRHGPREFSWFIFRVTNPTMREFFMYPRNPLRVKEALLSVLAGDIYGHSPIGWSLRAFKTIYYLVSLRHPGRTWRAWKQRRLNIRDVGAPAA